MKTQISILLCLAFFMLEPASYGQQSLWNIGESCDEGAAAIYQFNLSKDSLQKIYNFPSKISGRGPAADVIPDGNGHLYGITYRGGKHNFGSIYKYSISTGEYEELYTFGPCESELSSPVGLTLLGNNKLYGNCLQGGDSYNGGIFSFDLNTMTYQKLFDFDSSAWTIPGIREMSDGKLYGIHRSGVIYSYDPLSAIYTEHAQLKDSTTGSNARGLWVEGPNGKLYTATNFGGPNIYGGTLVSFDPASDQIELLINFPVIIGETGIIQSGLLTENNGILYGVARAGGTDRKGSLYTYDIAQGQYSTMLDFDSTVFSGPFAGELLPINGKLYGGANAGGANNLGGLFSIDPITKQFEVLYHYKSEDPGATLSSLVLVGDTLFGTRGGGKARAGRIFRYEMATDSFTNVLEFNESPYGDQFLPSLFKYDNGKIYGATRRGGDYLMGSIFELDPQLGTVQNVFSFHPLLARFPNQLTRASDGKLYGLAFDEDGSSDLIFKYDPIINSFQTIHQPQPNLYNYYYEPQMFEGPDQRFYIVSPGYRKIYVYDPQANSTQILHDFQSSNFVSPTGNICFGTDGNLYGMTDNGGMHDGGFLYTYDLAKDEYRELFHFSDATGKNPKTGLIELSPGVFAGMTTEGGAMELGTLFKYNLNDSTFTKWYDFSSSQGYWGLENGSLIQSQQGMIYGVAPVDGKDNQLFKFNPADSTMSIAMDVCVELCDRPYSYFSLFDMSTDAIDEPLSLANLKIYPNPAREKIRLSFSMPKPTSIEISLYNMLGKSCRQSPQMNGQMFDYSMGVQDLPSGVYMVQIQAEGRSISKKIIIH